MKNKLLWDIENLQQDTGQLTRAFIAQDPVTGIVEFSLYHDDGKGNGNHIFSCRWPELLKLIAQYGTERVG